MARHAQLKFVMTECSKTQIRLTRPKCYFYSAHSWGRGENGAPCRGCDHQETFINCADISIHGWNVEPPPDPIPDPVADLPHKTDPVPTPIAKDFSSLLPNPDDSSTAFETQTIIPPTLPELQNVQDSNGNNRPTVPPPPYKNSVDHHEQDSAKSLPASANSDLFALFDKAFDKVVTGNEYVNKTEVNVHKAITEDEMKSINQSPRKDKVVTITDAAHASSSESQLSAIDRSELFALLDITFSKMTGEPAVSDLSQTSKLSQSDRSPLFQEMNVMGPFTEPTYAHLSSTNKERLPAGKNDLKIQDYNALKTTESNGLKIEGENGLKTAGTNGLSTTDNSTLKTPYNNGLKPQDNKYLTIAGNSGLKVKDKNDLNTAGANGLYTAANSRIRKQHNKGLNAPDNNELKNTGNNGLKTTWKTESEHNHLTDTKQVIRKHAHERILLSQSHSIETAKDVFSNRYTHTEQRNGSMQDAFAPKYDFLTGDLHMSKKPNYQTKHLETTATTEIPHIKVKLKETSKHISKPYKYLSLPAEPATEVMQIKFDSFIKTDYNKNNSNKTSNSKKAKYLNAGNTDIPKTDIKRDTASPKQVLQKLPSISERKQDASYHHTNASTNPHNIAIQNRYTLKQSNLSPFEPPSVKSKLDNLQKKLNEITSGWGTPLSASDVLAKSKTISKLLQAQELVNSAHDLVLPSHDHLPVHDHSASAHNHGVPAHGHLHAHDHAVPAHDHGVPAYKRAPLIDHLLAHNQAVSANQHAVPAHAHVSTHDHAALAKNDVIPDKAKSIITEIPYNVADNQAFKHVTEDKPSQLNPLKDNILHGHSINRVSENNDNITNDKISPFASTEGRVQSNKVGQKQTSDGNLPHQNNKQVITQSQSNANIPNKSTNDHKPNAHVLDKISGISPDKTKQEQPVRAHIRDTNEHHTQMNIHGKFIHDRQSHVEILSDILQPMQRAKPDANTPLQLTHGHDLHVQQHGVDINSKLTRAPMSRTISAQRNDPASGHLRTAANPRHHEVLASRNGRQDLNIRGNDANTQYKNNNIGTAKLHSRTHSLPVHGSDNLMKNQKKSNTIKDTSSPDLSKDSETLKRLPTRTLSEKQTSHVNIPEYHHQAKDKTVPNMDIHRTLHIHDLGQMVRATQSTNVNAATTDKLMKGSQALAQKERESFMNFNRKHHEMPSHATGTHQTIIHHDLVSAHGKSPQQHDTHGHMNRHGTDPQQTSGMFTDTHSTNTHLDTGILKHKHGMKAQRDAGADTDRHEIRLKSNVGMHIDIHRSIPRQGPVSPHSEQSLLSQHDKHSSPNHSNIGKRHGPHFSTVKSNNKVFDPIHHSGNHLQSEIAKADSRQVSSEPSDPVSSHDLHVSMQHVDTGPQSGMSHPDQGHKHHSSRPKPQRKIHDPVQHSSDHAKSALVQHEHSSRPKTQHEMHDPVHHSGDRSKSALAMHEHSPRPKTQHENHDPIHHSGNHPQSTLAKQEHSPQHGHEHALRPKTKNKIRDTIHDPVQHSGDHAKSALAQHEHSSRPKIQHEMHDPVHHSGDRSKSALAKHEHSPQPKTQHENHDPIRHSGNHPQSTLAKQEHSLQHGHEHAHRPKTQNKIRNTIHHSGNHPQSALAELKRQSRKSNDKLHSNRDHILHSIIAQASHANHRGLTNNAQSHVAHGHSDRHGHGDRSRPHRTGNLNEQKLGQHRHANDLTNDHMLGDLRAENHAVPPQDHGLSPHGLSSLSDRRSTLSRNSALDQHSDPSTLSRGQELSPNDHATASHGNAASPHERPRPTPPANDHWTKAMEKTTIDNFVQRLTRRMETQVNKTATGGHDTHIKVLPLSKETIIQVLHAIAYGNKAPSNAHKSEINESLAKRTNQAKYIVDSNAIVRIKPKQAVKSTTNSLPSAVLDNKETPRQVLQTNGHKMNTVRDSLTNDIENANQRVLAGNHALDIPIKRQTNKNNRQVLLDLSSVVTTKKPVIQHHRKMHGSGRPSDSFSKRHTKMSKDNTALMKHKERNDIMLPPPRSQQRIESRSNTVRRPDSSVTEVSPSNTLEKRIASLWRKPQDGNAPSQSFIPREQHSSETRRERGNNPQDFQTEKQHSLTAHNQPLITQRSQTIPGQRLRPESRVQSQFRDANERRGSINRSKQRDINQRIVSNQQQNARSRGNSNRRGLPNPSYQWTNGQVKMKGFRGAPFSPRQHFMTRHSILPGDSPRLSPDHAPERSPLNERQRSSHGQRGRNIDRSRSFRRPGKTRITEYREEQGMSSLFRQTRPRNNFRLSASTDRNDRRRGVLQTQQRNPIPGQSNIRQSSSGIPNRQPFRTHTSTHRGLDTIERIDTHSFSKGNNRAVFVGSQDGAHRVISNKDLGRGNEALRTMRRIITQSEQRSAARGDPRRRIVVLPLNRKTVSRIFGDIGPRRQK